MVGFFQWVVVHQKQIPERFVMALEMAKAVQTPLAPPDMSSPSSNFANLSFINSTSAITDGTKKFPAFSIATRSVETFFPVQSHIDTSPWHTNKVFCEENPSFKNHLNLTRHDLGQQT
jgi:hypothetical protein